MKQGDVITENDINVRPGFGLSPKFYDKLIGLKVAKAVENTPVTRDSVNLTNEEFSI